MASLHHAIIFSGRNHWDLGALNPGAAILGTNRRFGGDTVEGIVRWFERRGEIALVPPRALREYGPITDDPERYEEDYSLDTISGVAFVMDYCDSHGWASTRTVRCLKIDPRHPARITAYCHLRERVQTFRADRIISVTDLRSGRLLSEDEHLALLAPYLSDGQGRPYFQPLLALQDAARDGVYALLHLAMSEGRLCDDARKFVLEYVKAEAEAVALPLPSSDLLTLWIDNLSPPLGAVSESVIALLTEKDRFVRLLPWILKAVRSQDTFAAQEESLHELIEEVRGYFRRRLCDLPGTLRATN